MTPIKAVSMGYVALFVEGIHHRFGSFHREIGSFDTTGLMTHLSLLTQQESDHRFGSFCGMYGSFVHKFGSFDTTGVY